MNPFTPSNIQQVIGFLSSGTEDLGSLSTEELEVLYAIKLRRFILTKRISYAAGFVSSFAAGKFLLSSRSPLR
jgi:hypothetical protein